MKKLMWAVTALMVTLVAGCATTVFQDTKGTQVITVERECGEGETPPCFDFREGPAGGTRMERSSWCADHPGLCTAAILGGSALVIGAGAAVWCAADGNCVPEGGHFDASGGQPGGR